MFGNIFEIVPEISSEISKSIFGPKKIFFIKYFYSSRYRNASSNCFVKSFFVQDAFRGPFLQILLVSKLLDEALN